MGSIVWLHHDCFPFPEAQFLRDPLSVSVKQALEDIFEREGVQMMTMLRRLQASSSHAMQILTQK
jgi:hypothetical protein